MSKRIFLLDGHSLAHRAFYALPLLSNSEGTYTNAVFGFGRMLFKLIDEQDPDLITVAFDTKAQTFRHEEYDEYKATRKKMPDELTPQIGLIKEFLAALNIPIFEIDGYEGDDVIGTLAKKGEDEGMKVHIVTGDRDSLQLVTDKINVMYTKRGITNIVEYDLDKVREEYELEPEQLVDMKGLMGDNSDNIPGVPGIGPKTATKLLKEFSTLENVLDNIDQVSGKKRKENLRKYSEQARLSKTLGKILIDVPIDINLDDCYMEKPDQKKLVDFLERMEITSFLDRFQEDEEVEVEDIKIKELTAEQDVEELINKIEKAGEVALDFILEDLNRPVKSEFEQIIVSINKDEVYSIASDFVKLFSPVFSDENINKYFVHAKECSIMLKRNDIELKGIEFDPLLAAYLLHPSNTLPSLSDLISNELNIVLPEDISLEKKAAFFVQNIFEIREILIEKLEKMSLDKLYYEIELPLIQGLAEMEFNGIMVDREYLQELSDKWEERLDIITQKAYELAGEEFNLNSPKQMGEILFDKLKLPVIKKTKTGYSTSASVLEKLEDKHEIIPLIMEYRQLAKLKSTYVDALPPLINPETERIHTSFNQMVTATGRLSSTEPNLQNIPIRTEEGREIRKAFIPWKEDWVLLAADYSQVELRVLAHISKDESLISAFNSQKDIHTQTATEVFAVEPDDVTANMRREAKVINFGIAYGMSPYGLARDLDISRQEAEKYIERYFERFSGVKKYMDQIVKQAKDEGYVSTIFNRRRYIPEIRSRNYHRRSFAERTAINTPIQGSAADIMKIALNNVYDRLSKEDYLARILLQVHDELVLEVASEDLDKVSQIVKEEMEGAVELSVPLEVDLEVGENWRDKEKI